MSDPFAEVDAANAAKSSKPKGAAAAAPAEDPFTGAHDSADPFATSDDFRGGDFTPSPPIELLRGRLLAYFPRKFDPEAENVFATKPTDPKTRELYTADVYVLDGGPLKFPYKIKGDPEKGTEDTWEEFDAGTPTAAEPFVMKQSWVPQGGLIGKLKQAHRAGTPFLGVLDYVPQKPDRDRGKTAAQVRADVDAWVARGKVGDSPKYAWGADVPSPERRKIAIEFWAAHKAEIEPINRAGAPAAAR